MSELLCGQLSALKDFRQKLVDDESLEIFDSRLHFLIYRDWEKLRRSIESVTLNKELILDWQLKEFLDNQNGKKIIIFGAGLVGRLTKKILNNAGIDVVFFCDNNRELQGSIVDGLMVLNPKDLVYDYKDCSVILAISGTGGKQCYFQLINDFFPTANIFFPRGGRIVATHGIQYFDIPYFKSENDEVFIDGGAFNGATSLDFITWCKGNYEKIYLFEPNGKNMINCKENLKEQDNIQFIEMGLSNSEGEFNFNYFGAGSGIVESGDEVVKVSSIDNVLSGAKATFVKLDIEGQELSALQGAEKTIKTFYPRLAICMYHKPEDFIEIPYYLMQIAPDYKYCLRHYTTSYEETVLYAWR